MTKTTSLDSIKQQIEKLQSELAALQEQAAAERAKAMEEVVSEIRTKIAEYGISAKELGFAEGRGKGRKAGKAKVNTPVIEAVAGTVYQGPNGETWTGGTRGRKPQWLVQALADGATLEQLAQK